MINAIKAQALLPVLPWILDCDSAKIHSTTPATYEEEEGHLLAKANFTTKRSKPVTERGGVAPDYGRLQPTTT